MTDWRLRHQAALNNPIGIERAYVRILEGLEAYCDAYHARYGAHIGSDYILGKEGVQPILHGLRTLLNGELGRLDGGELDKRILRIVRSEGFDEGEF